MNPYKLGCIVAGWSKWGTYWSKCPFNSCSDMCV